jgi:predicted O-methyltransferase YrrM
MIEDVCRLLEKQLPITSYQICEEFDLLQGHPWAYKARDAATTFYACLYGIVQPEHPSKVFEVGTAFGMGTAALLKACQRLDLLVSVDLGIYGYQFAEALDNIEFVQSRVHDWCKRNNIPSSRVKLYKVNTQPYPYGDNENLGTAVPRWSEVPEIVRLFQENRFDVIFVDGKHTDDGLLNDLTTFWPFLREGGLAICDDLHDPAEFAGMFPWVGATWRSYHSFIANYRTEIADHYIWNYPRVPPGGKNGLRPIGFLRKKFHS